MTRTSSSKKKNKNLFSSVKIKALNLFVVMLMLLSTVSVFAQFPGQGQGNQGQGTNPFEQGANPFESGGGFPGQGGPQGPMGQGGFGGGSGFGGGFGGGPSQGGLPGENMYMPDNFEGQFNPEKKIGKLAIGYYLSEGGEINCEDVPATVKEVITTLRESGEVDYFVEDMKDQFDSTCNGQENPNVDDFFQNFNEEFTCPADKTKQLDSCKEQFKEQEEQMDEFLERECGYQIEGTRGFCEGQDYQEKMNEQNKKNREQQTKEMECRSQEGNYRYNWNTGECIKEEFGPGPKRQQGPNGQGFGPGP
ncbi:MAG: hypothetical protein Q7K42_01285, partial [Candidatus Diapherotrites archaeon]|nr:hypothetical protein [Candidatus Diapherotrites archaeon]